MAHNFFSGPMMPMPDIIQKVTGTITGTWDGATYPFSNMQFTGLYEQIKDVLKPSHTQIEDNFEMRLHPAYHDFVKRYNRYRGTLDYLEGFFLSVFDMPVGSVNYRAARVYSGPFGHAKGVRVEPECVYDFNGQLEATFFNELKGTLSIPRISGILHITNRNLSFDGPEGKPFPPKSYYKYGFHLRLLESIPLAYQELAH